MLQAILGRAMKTAMIVVTMASLETERNLCQGMFLEECAAAPTIAIGHCGITVACLLMKPVSLFADTNTTAEQLGNVKMINFVTVTGVAVAEHPGLN
ncbi:uncharacterized protein LOC106168513 isoform X2 [Lingula anatina]|uniref:Uncharacterized protein LOC106168513 isoform X2 n=1 Tax=Lingula anatina TaxID=7574 RepID=A0A1S3IYF9_LINAN|nr:uncharacterized protein LOC106168513 isoform X2 [Lingula anatina]|eukprot:XP_013403053.1 uncharacterized protein LOC106168513 isoform X2 [Lingula anatina]